MISDEKKLLEKCLAQDENAWDDFVDLVRSQFVRKERRKNSTKEGLQAYRALGEKLEN